MRLLIEVLRRAFGRPDKTVVARIIRVFRFVHDVLAGRFVIVPAVAAVHRPVQRAPVNVLRRVIAGPVELPPVPRQPFDRSDHGHTGAEGFNIRARALQGIIHPRLCFRRAEDRPHVAEIGVVVSVIGGIEAATLFAVNAQFRNAERFELCRAQVVDPAQADAVCRNSVQRQ